MQLFSFNDTKIENVKLINPFVDQDIRGNFVKDYSEEIFREAGYPYEVKEVFYAGNEKGVVRGLHFQRKMLMPKLVRCITGRIYDVVVDLRKGSATFGLWQGFYMSGDTFEELLIPGCCAHGYLVLEPAIVTYKCAEKFYKEYDDGIQWNDEVLGIKWPINMVERIIISPKDSKLQTYEHFINHYEGL